MRGVGKLLTGIAIITAGFLLYVHERVEMLRESYQIYKTSRQLSERAEEYRRLKFEVTQLRSPEALEKRLQEVNLSLTLPKQIKVLRVPQPLAQPTVETLPLRASWGHFFDFVGQWIQVAQARTDQ